MKYIYIQLILYLNKALVMNKAKTSLSLLGGQLGENSSQSKNKEKKGNILGQVK